MRVAPALIVVTIGLLIGGCAPVQSTKPLSSPPQDSSSNDVAPDCMGRFTFETEHSGSGQSICKYGDGVHFTAHTEQSVAAGLVCNYTLNYIKPTEGNGQLSCSDGTTGALTFSETGPRDGTAVARMKDGREIRFSYTKQI